MTRTRAQKGRTLDRLDRRNVVANLLAHTHRRQLTSAEAALLGDYVREEERQADETRKAMAGTTQALERHRAAADAAIRELEQCAENFEGRAKAMEQRAADVCATTSEALDASQATLTRYRKRAEQAEEQAKLHARAAEQADAVTAETKRLMQRRTTTLRERAERAEATLDRIRNANGIGDVARAVAEHDGLTPEAASANAAFVEAADSTEARLAEQAREHAIALATARRNTAAAADEAREQCRRVDAAERFAKAANARAWDAEQSRDRFEAAWHSARQRAAEQRTLASTRQERLRIRARRILEWEMRAEQAERSAAGWEDTARTYATGMDDARARVDSVRQYIDAVYEGDVCEGVRRDVRRLCAGEEPTYRPPGAPEVVTDREAIRNTLAEPEPATLAEAGVTAAEAADRLHQWATAGVPVGCRNPHHLHRVIPPGPQCQ